MISAAQKISISDVSSRVVQCQSKLKRMICIATLPMAQKLYWQRVEHGMRFSLLSGGFGPG